MKHTGHALLALIVGCAVFSRADSSFAGSGTCAVTGKVDVISRLPLLPGEPLDLNLRITNPANAAIKYFVPSEESGSVRLLFSDDSAPESFRSYRGPLWGLVDDADFPQTLRGQASYDLRLRVLHHVRQRDPFVFNQPGTYRVKLTYSDGLACTTRVETPALNVAVVAPTGVDLAVWSAIKDCSSCAFFLHTGEARSTQADKDAVLLLQTLAKQYPKSRYAKLIRKQLDTLDDKSHDTAKDNGGKHDD